MAKALGAWLVVGAVLVAGVASGIGLKKPFRIDGTGDLTVPFVLLGLWFVIYLMLGIAAVGDAVRLVRRRDLNTLQDSANLVKLIAVPFFALNFIALAQVVTLIGSNDKDRFGLDGFLVALLFVVLTYLVLLPTSAYGVGCLVVLKRGDGIGPITFGLNMVLHFLYVVDVLSGIVVVEIARDRLGIARPPGPLSRYLLAGVVIVGSSLAAVWLVFTGIFYSSHPLGIPMPYAINLLGLTSSMEFFLLVVVPVAPLVAFRTAVRFYLGEDINALARSARVVKLGMIPLFLQNFVLCAVVVLALTLLPIAISRGAVLFFMGAWGYALVGAFTTAGLVPAVIGTYLMLLPTSIYSLTTLAFLMRRRAITPRFCALHTVLQLIFITDIISTLAIAHRAKQLNRHTVTTP
ncbi:hypothetical protein [Kribbella sp. NPDC004875]|uniref:hypothetical protein n=1 Tax=Kribbella sp. NPDC004875 TaxID=3364107 RepID=UPI0036CA92DC